MIGQIDIEKSLLNAPNDRSLFVAIASVVNSLVDAVNELQNKKDTKKEPLNRYIKQRKWVGKLCKFEGENYGILKEIGCSNTKQVWRDGAFRSSDGYWYDFCEPVKPDDPIIYKGGDNE